MKPISTAADKYRTFYSFVEEEKPQWFKPIDFAVFARMLLLSEIDSPIDVSVPHLMATCGGSEYRIRKSLNRLVKHDWLRAIDGGYRIYRIWI